MIRPTQEATPKQAVDNASPKETQPKATASEDQKRLDGLMKNGKTNPIKSSDKKGGGESLNALFGQALGGLTGNAGQPTTMSTAELKTPIAAANSETLGSQCAELVDRIIAAQPSADGRTEVRITVDKPWLPDTEIRLVLTADKRLEVEFIANNPEAQRFLQPNLSTLRDRLADRTDTATTVLLSESSDGNANDGRSRNRRSIYEENAKE